MTHTDRCENSRTDKKKCRCKGCKGERHALNRQQADEHNGNEKELTLTDGGEVAEFIQYAQGKEYSCLGYHSTMLGFYSKEDGIHVATKFYGYPHDGGLSDKEGRKWWVYVKCSAPIKHSYYATSFQHFDSAVQRAKTYRKYIQDWGNY